MFSISVYLWNRLSSGAMIAGEVFDRRLVLLCGPHHRHIAAQRMGTQEIGSRNHEAKTRLTPQPTASDTALALDPVDLSMFEVFLDAKRLADILWNQDARWKEHNPLAFVELAFAADRLGAFDDGDLQLVGIGMGLHVVDGREFNENIGHGAYLGSKSVIGKWLATTPGRLASPCHADPTTCQLSNTD